MTKKKKVWIIVISCILAVIALMVILFFTAFSLSEVSVEFETTTNRFSSIESQEQIISDGDIPNKSVFLLDKESITNKIEKSNPYLKVVNLEIKFPDRMIIHCAEREEYYAVKQNDTYLICDDELKVLHKTSTFISTKTNAILLNAEELTSDYDVGDFVSIDETINCALAKFADAMLVNNRTNSEALAYFKTITFSKRVDPVTFNEYDVIVLTNHSDFEFDIYAVFDDLDLKLQKLFAADVLITDSQRETHKAIIFKNSENEILCLVTEK